MKNENFETCKRIAEEIEAYANGGIVEIDGAYYDHDEIWDAEKNCYIIDGEEIDENDAKHAGLWDYFKDCFDIEITKSLGSDDIKYCRIMVACGGPNIYIDTGDRAVNLYWWTEEASYPLDADICQEIDYMVEELASCY